METHRKDSQAQATEDEWSKTATEKRQEEKQSGMTDSKKEDFKTGQSAETNDSGQREAVSTATMTAMRAMPAPKTSDVKEEMDSDLDTVTETSALASANQGRNDKGHESDCKTEKKTDNKEEPEKEYTTVESSEVQQKPGMAISPAKPIKPLTDSQGMCKQQFKRQLVLSTSSRTKFNEALERCNADTLKEILQDESYVKLLLRPILYNEYVDAADELVKKYNLDVKKIFNKNDQFCSPLSTLIEGECEVSVNYLLNKGVDANQECPCHDTPLTLACSRGNLKLAEKLVNEGAHLDGRTKPRLTPLMAAVKSGSVSVVQYLLEKGAVPNKHALDGWTALHSAVWSMRDSNNQLAKLLLDHNAVLSSDKDGTTPLMLAAKLGKVDMVDLFLQKRHLSKEEAADAMEICATSFAPDNMAAVKEWLNRAKKIRQSNFTNSLHKTDLDHVPAYGCEMERQPPQQVSGQGHDKLTFIKECLTIRKRHHLKWMDDRWLDKIQNYLFEKGHYTELSHFLKYDPDIPLDTSLILLETSCIRLAKITENDQQIDFNCSVLFLDACNTHLTRHVDVNRNDVYARSSVYNFMFATVICMEICMQRRRESSDSEVKCLSNKIKDILHRLQEDGRPIYSPLNMAVRLWVQDKIDSETSLHAKLIDILLACEAPVNCIDKEGDTPLHILARCDKSKARDKASLLLQNGADLDIQDARGQTPVQRAVTSEMRTFLSSIPRPLKCLATHAILEGNIGIGQLPDALQKFVRNHIRSHEEIRRGAPI